MAQAPKSVRVTLRASEDETMLSGCDVVLEVPDADEAALTADGGVITGTVVSGDFDPNRPYTRLDGRWRWEYKKASTDRGSVTVTVGQAERPLSA